MKFVLRSMPLFQNRKKVKIAKAQAISAQLMQESAKDRVEASLMSLFNEMQQLKDAMNAYDVPLMYRSLDLLKQRQGAPYHKTIHRNRIIRVTAKAGFQLRQPSLAVYRNLLLGGTGSGGGGLQVKV